MDDRNSHASEKGWTNAEIGPDWLEEVITPDMATEISELRLVIVDGHGSHNNKEPGPQCFMRGMVLLQQTDLRVTPLTPILIVPRPIQGLVNIRIPQGS